MSNRSSTRRFTCLCDDNPKAFGVGETSATRFAFLEPCVRLNPTENEAVS